MKTAATGLSILVAVTAAYAQGTVISSVKPSAALERAVGGGNRIVGSIYRVTNAPLTFLLETAFALPQNQILGGPDWMTSERWDVEAKF